MDTAVMDAEPEIEIVAEAKPERPAIFETVLTRQIRYIVAVCSVGAGIIHLLAMLDHRGAPTLSRTFFALAVFQIVWAIVLLTGARHWIVYGIGAAVTAAAIGVWVVARTKGISWFPGLDHVEAIGWRDTVTQFFQLLALAGTAILMLPASVHQPAGKRIEAAPIAIFTLLAILTLSVLYAATHGAAPHPH